MSLSTLHTDTVAEQTFWRQQVPATDLDGLAVMEDVYVAWLRDEARYVVYPMTRWDDTAKAYRTDARLESESAALAQEVWTFTLATARQNDEDKKLLAAFALNAARAAAFWVGGEDVTAASKAVRAAVKSALRGRDAHRGDIESDVAEKAAHYITEPLTAGAAAPLSGRVEEHMPLLDIFGLVGALEYFHALRPALAAAERKELALSDANLARDTRRALDDATRALSGATVEEKDAARSLAAHRSRLAGMTDDERVVLEAERIVAISKMRGYRRWAAEDAAWMLDDRLTASADEMLDAGLDFAAEEDDEEPKKPMYEVADGSWDALASQFGVQDGAELQAIIAERMATDRKAAGEERVQTGFIAALTGDAKSARAQALRRAAKKLDLDAVRTALAAALV
ncbi:hypothetical protein AB1K56_03365 [Microbacterium sp. BWR-S6Y]|uniref:hypothetical protein n=1 Tax=Microbacterium sp. BWR-S6Y TaxID=3232073 RepID=UPI00352904B9